MRRTTEFARRRRGYCCQCDRGSARPSRVVRADATVVTNAALARRRLTDVTALATHGTVEEVAAQIDAGVAAHRLPCGHGTTPGAGPTISTQVPVRTARSGRSATTVSTAVGQPGVAHRRVGHAHPALARLVSRAAEHAPAAMEVIGLQVDAGPTAVGQPGVAHQRRGVRRGRRARPLLAGFARGAGDAAGATVERVAAGIDAGAAADGEGWGAVLDGRWLPHRRRQYSC